MQINEMIEKMQAKWDKPFVLRIEALSATQGVYTWRTLLEADRNGTGPANKFKIGNKVAYPVEDFYHWFEKKMVRR